LSLQLVSQSPRPGARLSRRKLIAFAAITALVPVLLITLALLGLDFYLHHRAERSAGLNRWGYRGPVVGSKQPGETRIAVLGGSTAFGYGVPWFEAAPAVLERELNTQRPGQSPVSVVNLGFNNEGAYAYRPTLDDFRFLDYDVAVLFDGYNDMAGDVGRNTALFRHDSPIFRLTGYYPILPLVFAEKAMVLRTGGDLNAGYAAYRGERQTVFKPSLADRASASALESAAAVSDSLGRQLDRLSAPSEAKGLNTPALRATASGCAFPWTFYCESMHEAVRHSLDLGKRVVVVLQPRLPDPTRVKHMEQQQALTDMLTRSFAADSRFLLVDLSGAVDVSDRNYCFDGMHLSTDGIKREVAALVAATGPDFLIAGSSR
jgi:hypothetical protein